MPKPGDVVVMDFLGATGIKRRPAVIVSSDLYHQNRPDVIVGVVTSNLLDATTPTDWALLD
jgi:mRNA interferase MazF